MTANLRSAALMFLSASMLIGQALDPAKLLQPPTDTWPTFHGDYSGRRYSPLSQINASNVRSLSGVSRECGFYQINAAGSWWRALFHRTR
jgi:alcohol dehydrogenase (cytochrome c)